VPAQPDLSHCNMENYKDNSNTEAVYADLVRLYPKDTRYIRRYAETLIANGRITTATEILHQLHDILIESGERNQAAQLAREFPQIGRIVKEETEDSTENYPFLNFATQGLAGKIWTVTHQRTLKEGKHLFRRGDPGDSMYVVLKGELAVYVPDDSGKLVLLNLITHGNVVGEGALLNPSPRGADVVANKDSTVVELPRKKVLSYLLENPDVEAALILENEQRHMVSLLSRNTILQHIPMDMRHFLGKQAEIAHYSAGTVIHKGGDELDSVDIMTKGKAHYVFTAKSGNRTSLHELPIGQLIGDMSVLRNDTSAKRKIGCPADIVAIEDTIMAHIPFSAFKNVVEAYPPLRESLFKTAEIQMSKIMRKVAQVAGHNK